ncbi:hypothetical protein [Pseudoneobacillus rhizosphaerae]|uniref:Nuclease SbcCD subunit C n=1 Tax=Pseudoneobacillus rhizosphaerae TaxID=2880968 RepID=A0A9C7G6F0_9BACI|nr:hypothetical protein [Pseudoneobacillus rhizosphaerae]CAG9606849.1 hypothetical protein NEOCIP111885_00537 [Pseudoneobacillus rhizosphaerae]
MIKIRRLRVEIHTKLSILGFDESFDDQMNIICSDKNTSGKSSIISSIYYALGLEEIIGGRGYNVLSSAFKTKIESEEGELNVLESKVYLEVTNGTKDITILRAAKMKDRESNLMTIFHSKMDKINEINTLIEDMYVHSQNSATSRKGFFTFLESFLGMELPSVPGTDDREKKLYLQLIFSSMLIEQKRGWADLFSGMPHFGIREPKKRVIEYLLNMDTLTNEKLKHHLKIKENKIIEMWKQLYKETTETLREVNLNLRGVNENVEILHEPERSINIVYNSNGNLFSLDQFIKYKKFEYGNLIKLKPKNINNFQELKAELRNIEEDIINYETKLKDTRFVLNNENNSIDRLKHSLELIQTDIVNNQDAKKLRNLGSKEGFNSYKDICPTCNQPISDTLLVSQNKADVMSIDDNINHLKSQEKVFEHAIEQKRQIVKKLNKDISEIEKVVTNLYRLAKVTRNDIFAIDGTISESDIYKKIELTKIIERLEIIEVENIINNFKKLSDEWKLYLSDLEKLPKNKFTELDEKKLKSLRDHFVSNLKTFGYRSSSDIDKVMISRDSYMPTIENFDLKFDSSASDHIRRIWAFTIALAQTANELNGNHPGILIFDEPGQHSIVVEDMEAFFDCLRSIAVKNQVLVGITIKESDTRELIIKKIEEGSKGIIIKDRAFKKFE